MSQRTEERKKEAAERQALRDSRSDGEQYLRLRRAGHTHCKEATKIFGRLLVNSLTAEEIREILDASKSEDLAGLRRAFDAARGEPQQGE